AGQANARDVVKAAIDAFGQEPVPEPGPVPRHAARVRTWGTTRCGINNGRSSIAWLRCISEVPMRLRSLITLLPLAFPVLAPGIAGAAPPPTYPILPNQYFEGVVNGQTAGATIYTACPGPTTGYGHPISGQTLSVSRVSVPTTTDVGFT